MDYIRYKRIQLISPEPEPPPLSLSLTPKYYLYPDIHLLNDKVTYLQVMKRDCTWSGMDETYEHPIMTKYMAKFSSEEAAAEFKDTFEKVCIRALQKSQNWH